MNTYKKNNRLDRNLCEFFYREYLYDSLFDQRKIQQKRFNSKFWANQLFKLDCFVDELLSNDETPFVPYLGRNGAKEFAASVLASHYFTLIPGFTDIVDMLLPMYDYSEGIKVFMSCCNKMGLLGNRLEWKNIFYDPKKIDPRFGEVSAAEIFNTLVQAIRNEWKIKATQVKFINRKNAASARHYDYSKYVDSFFDDGCTRIMVLPIHLGYKEHYASSLNIPNIKKDLKHLLDNTRCNLLFQFRKGYIAKLEYAVDKGIYFHMLFFFDDSEGRNSQHIHSVEDIGEYWETAITKGRGDYWNANNRASRLDTTGKGGIWLINMSDTESRKKLKLVVGYLCKVDQFFKPKLGSKVRLIRKGQFSEKPIKKRGRPRKQGDS